MLVFVGEIHAKGRKREIPMMINNRPVFLDLTKFRFPIAAVMSVGHRASGIFMVLAIPFLIYLVELSLTGPEGFAEAKLLMDGVLARLILFVALWALLHHLLGELLPFFGTSGSVAATPAPPSPRRRRAALSLSQRY